MQTAKKQRKKLRRRRGFMGPLITSGNRRKYEETFRLDWLKKNEEQGNPDKLSQEEKDRLSRLFAFHEVRRQQKHLKAYIKGKVSYKYNGLIAPVMTPEFYKQQMLGKANSLKASNKGEEE